YLVRSLAHEDGAVDATDVHDVVGHQAVAALDQLEGRLALAYAGVARQQDSDAVHFDEHAVDGGLWREDVGKHAYDSAREFAGREVSLEDRAITGFGRRKKSLSGREIVRKDAAWHRIGEQLLEIVRPVRLIEHLEVGVLAASEDLQAIPCEGVVVSR